MFSTREGKGKGHSLKFDSPCEIRRSLILDCNNISAEFNFKKK